VAFDGLRDEMTNFLLKSASGLIQRFRFVLTVIILQQVLTAGNSPERRSAGPKGAALSQTRTGEDQSGTKKNSVRDLAEELGIPWRFFPIYAQIQTGSVLSNSLFTTRDRE
jgi:hypothetical protein